MKLQRRCKIVILAINLSNDEWIEHFSGAIINNAFEKEILKIYHLCKIKTSSTFRIILFYF